MADDLAVARERIATLERLLTNQVKTALRNGLLTARLADVRETVRLADANLIGVPCECDRCEGRPEGESTGPYQPCVATAREALKHIISEVKPINGHEIALQEARFALFEIRDLLFGKTGKPKVTDEDWERAVWEIINAQIGAETIEPPDVES